MLFFLMLYEKSNSLASFLVNPIAGILKTRPISELSKLFYKFKLFKKACQLKWVVVYWLKVSTIYFYHDLLVMTLDSVNAFTITVTPQSTLWKYSHLKAKFQWRCFKQKWWSVLNLTLSSSPSPLAEIAMSCMAMSF